MNRSIYANRITAALKLLEICDLMADKDYAIAAETAVDLVDILDNCTEEDDD